MYFSKSDKTVDIPAEHLQPGFVVNDGFMENEKYVILAVHTEGDITKINFQYIRGAESPVPRNPVIALEVYCQHPIPVEK